MKIYDISMEIEHNMPVYKDKEEKRPYLKSVSNPDNTGVYETCINMNMHTGTHVDAPLHMIRDGKTIDTLDLSKVITKCKVLDLTRAKNKITSKELGEFDIVEDDFIILKTRNSEIEDYGMNFVYLEFSGAEYLKKKKIKGVGIDALGIERNQTGHETHKTLMQEGIVILEGLKLKDIEPGEYILYAAPLRIKEAEAAPARAVLIQTQE